MAAKPKPDEGPRSNKDLITRFREEYAEALNEVRVSATHTATDGWQGLYQGFHKGNREARRGVSAELKAIAERLEVGDATESDEKDIGDIKKRVTELRAVREIFDRETVQPVREPVEKCHKVIADAKRQAESDEERAPMINIGLVDTMVMAIAEVERAAWDSDRGRVEIRPPNA